MRRQRHKRKTSQVVIVTSDAADAVTKQFRIRTSVVRALTLLLCAALGALIGVLIVAEDIRREGGFQTAQQRETITRLETENLTLQRQVEELNATIQILSDTVAAKTESESELSQQIESQHTPTEFPLTGSATWEEIAEGDPMCVFTSSEGAMVVATADGTVEAVNDDPEYGHNVWIDHGNGYVTIYRNSGEVKVKQGESVKQGTTLFLIGEENNTLGYQMMKDGAYVAPMDVLVISG